MQKFPILSLIFRYLHLPGIIVHMKKIVALILAFLFGSAILCDAQELINTDAQSATLYFNNLTRANGLPSERVKGVVQDFRGFVWIATCNGLVRYDGSHFDVFRHQASDTSSVVDNVITSLFLSHDSLLWIGGLDGVSIYNPFNGTFTNFSVGSASSKRFPSFFVNCFYEDTSGSMWVGTVDGLVHMTGNPRRLDFFPIKTSNIESNRGFNYKHITQIIAHPTNPELLLITTMGGLITVDKRKGVVLDEFPNPYCEKTGLNCMILEGNNTIWCSGWGMGMNCLDLETKKWTNFPYNVKDPVSIIGLKRKNADELWLASADQGLGIFNTRTFAFRFFPKQSDAVSSLISNTIVNIEFINKNEIWLTTDNGISILNSTFRSFRQVMLPREDLLVSSFCRDSLSGKLYVGTSNGLFTWDASNGQWDNITVTGFPKGESFGISKMIIDHQHRLWVSSGDHLYFLDDGAKALIPFKMKETEVEFSAISSITGLFEDSQRNLWIGTLFDGVWRIDQDRKDAANFPHSDNDEFSIIKATKYAFFEEDNAGRIWIGTNDGVSIYNPDQRNFYNGGMAVLKRNGINKRRIHGIAKDLLGRIWLDIDSEGLVMVDITDISSPRIVVFNSLNGLNDMAMGRMARDPNGDLWLVNYGLFHFNPMNGAMHLFNEYNALHNGLTVWELLYVDPVGNIFIGKGNAFETRNIKDMDFKPHPVRLVLDYMEVNGKRQGINASTSSDPVIQLEASENNLLFKFAVICFENSNRLSIRYKLEGFDEDWILAGDRREASYNNLPPGEYRFVLQLANSTEFSRQEARVSVIIPVIYYKTWWFRIIVALSVVLIIVIVIRNRFQHLLKIQKMRNRIARDLHDDIGSTLSSISIMSDLLTAQAVDEESANRIGSIGSNAKKMLEKMDDIIWTVNPANDSFSNLELRIREFAIPLLESRNITFSIRFDKHLSGISLPMEKRRDIYLIIKEAVNNLVKYSEGKNCIISFYRTSGGLCVEISDDGIGFDTSQSTSRNGLKNMKARATALGANLQIFSEIGKGTTTKLEMKTI